MLYDFVFQVRLSEVLDNGSVETKRLSKHQGRVHRLAVEPGSPYVFYSCGEDGFIQHVSFNDSNILDTFCVNLLSFLSPQILLQYDLRSNSATKLFFCSSIAENNRSSTSIGLNSIVIDPRNPNYFAVGGADVYARVYDVRRYQVDASTKAGSPFATFCARHLIGTHDAHITALAYSNTSELLVSYNDELIYLLQKNMGLGPNPLSSSSEELHRAADAQVYSGHRNSQTVKGVSFFGPNDEYVLSGSDCGHIFIWKKKGGELVRMMVGDRHIVNQLEQHPLIPVFASCGIEKNIKLWAPSSNFIKHLPDNVQEVNPLQGLDWLRRHSKIMCLNSSFLKFNDFFIFEQIMEANRQGREDHSRVTFTPDVIMHVLRLHRRQARIYIEPRYNRGDIESDDDNDGEAYVLGFSDGDPAEDGGNSRECNIS